MPWISIDDNFPDHPKVTAAGPLAAWLHVCGMAYCGRYLTDGHIPARQIPRLADLDDPLALAERLVEVGLWEEVEGGYLVHDYLKYNPSRAQVEAKREANARRQAAFRNRKSAPSDAQDETPSGPEQGPKRRGRSRGNAESNGVSNGVSNAVSNALVTAPPPLPSPPLDHHDDDQHDDDDDGAPPPRAGGRDLLRERWQETVCAGRALTRADREDLAARVAAYGEPAVLEALERMREQPRERWCRKYLDVTMENLADENRPPPEPPPVDVPDVERVDAPADVPWWGDFAARVRAAVPERAFETWLADAWPAEHSDGVLVLAVGNAYGKEWCEERLYRAVQRAATEAAGRTVSVRFVVRGTRRAPPGVAMGEACAVVGAT